MKVRSAKISDGKAIHSLINQHAERDRMLFRPIADIYKNLQAFSVAESDGALTGCCALEVVWADLAEIKSLAVDQASKGAGVGRMLVAAALRQAAELGIEKIFALTLEPQFFQKLGFEVIDKDVLPMKVWSDCAKCPKQDHCDEIAVIKGVSAEA
jgi:amino-acid N-acetyltransferase